MLNSLYNTKIRYLLFVIIFFAPKYSLIPVDGMWQGVRIDDILIFAYFLYLLIYNNQKEYFFFNDKTYLKFLLFFLYIFFVSIISILNGIEIKEIMIIRIFEYIVIICLINNLKLKKNNLNKLLKIFLLINFFFAVLQNMKLIGSISSLGYLDPSNSLNLRSFGIMGGSWELAVTASIAYFGLSYISNKKNLIFYFFITIILLYLAQSRTSIFAFIISCLILHRDLIYKKKIILLFLLLIFFLLLLKKDFNLLFYVEKYFLLINESYEIIYKFFAHDEVIKLSNILNYKSDILSLIYRTYEWKIVASFSDNDFYHTLFGTGLTTLYTDSLLIRILYNFGFIGIAILIFNILNLPLYYVIFLIINGLMLDLLVSIKIFIIILIFLKILNYKKNNNYGSDN